MIRWAFGLVSLCATVAIWAQTEPVPAGQVAAESYQSIETKRGRESAILDAQEAECYQRFAVNDCLKNVKSKRIALTAELKRQDNEIHARERRQQGDEALERANQKALEQKREQEHSQTEDGMRRAQEKFQAQQDKRAEHAAKALSDVAPVGSRSTNGTTAEERAQSRASLKRKLANAEKKRQEVAKRLAEKSDKSVKPLPVPP